jgi:hypothetical protein
MAGACAWLLMRAYRSSRYRLLFWSGLYFLLSTANNLLMMVDKLVLPHVDLSVWRYGMGFAATVVLVVGLIWSAE